MSEHTKSSLFSGASPKLTFVMGILVGVAGVSLVGFILALVVSLGANGGLAKVFTKGDVDNKPVAAVNDTKPSQPGTNQPSAKVDIQVRADEFVRGEQGAPVTLVEYSDLECPYCKRFHPAMQQIMQDYAGKVRWIYRQFPLSFHANAEKEAEAAECVGKLGGGSKYWEFIDKIYERTTSNGTGFALADLPKLAQEVGVNQASFKTCLNNGEMAAKVQKDLQEGSGYGVGGTPTTFINGRAVEGAVPLADLKAAVEQALAGK